jgi:F0F1-type ATP synthase membrane subunit c/vacuolar-type H+-ATPase subunit K
VLVVALMLAAFTALTVEAQEAERALVVIGKTIGAGVAVGMDGATAVSAITKKKRGLRNGLASSGLRRGVAIYGLLIALLIVLAFTLLERVFIRY